MEQDPMLRTNNLEINIKKGNQTRYEGRACRSYSRFLFDRATSNMERETGFEPATCTLARYRSTN